MNGSFCSSEAHSLPAVNCDILSTDGHGGPRGWVDLRSASKVGMSITYRGTEVLRYNLRYLMTLVLVHVANFDTRRGSPRPERAPQFWAAWRLFGQRYKYQPCNPTVYLGSRYLGSPVLPPLPKAVM